MFCNFRRNFGDNQCWAPTVGLNTHCVKHLPKDPERLIVTGPRPVPKPPRKGLTKLPALTSTKPGIYTAPTGFGGVKAVAFTLAEIKRITMM